MGGLELRTFPMGICLKVNVIAQLEFELTYYITLPGYFLKVYVIIKVNRNWVETDYIPKKKKKHQ